MTERFGNWRGVVVMLLSFVAFSCSLAAEFRKLKASDMKLDGSLCSLPKSSAFGLGITAVVSLSLAQVIGTSTAAAAAVTSLFSAIKSNNNNRTRIASITLLVLSWVSYALAIILLATATSMNSGQYYGKGWMDGECYIVRNGVFGGAAALVVVTAIFVLGFMYMIRSTVASMTGTLIYSRTSPDSEGRDHQPKETHTTV